MVKRIGAVTWSMPSRQTHRARTSRTPLARRQTSRTSWARLARRAAAIEAVGLLSSDGVVVEVTPYDSAGVSGGQKGGFDALQANFKVAWMSGGGGTRGRGSIQLPLAASPARVRMSRWRLSVSPPLDPEVFRSDLLELDLDTRTLRALDEAFRALRFGLLLTTAVLAGAVVEGGVRTLARRLIPIATSERIAKDLASSRMRSVSARMITILREIPERGLPARADQLASHVNRFVDLRNYGAHTGESDRHLETWFADELQGAMLLADARYTLVSLADAIRDRLTVEEQRPA